MFENLVMDANADGDANTTTPDVIRRRRALAQALMQQGMDYSPVQHWTQGAARLGDAFAGYIQRKRADKEEGAATKAAREQESKFFDMMNPAPQASQSPAGAVPDDTIQRQDMMPVTAPKGATDGEWLKYQNQHATRDQPISADLQKSMAFLPELGVTMDVFSGGQDATGPNRTGSHRHDHGGAADVFFSQNGKRLDWRNEADIPVLQQIVQRAHANGVTGFGAGDGYMQPGSMHVGFGSPGVWGNGGKGGNAPEWLRQAYNGQGGEPQVQPAGGVQVASSDPQQAFQAAAPSNDRARLAAAMAVMNNEYASPASKALAQALLSREKQNPNQDAMQQLQLESARLGVQKLRRDLAPQEKEPKPAPANVQEYQFYVEQEKAAGRQPIGYYDFQKGKSPSTTVNVGGEPADGALRKQLDEESGKLWGTYQTSAGVSAGNAQDMQMLDQLIKVAPQGPVVGNLAKAFPGVSSAGAAFTSVVNRVAPTLRTVGSGSTSDVEYDGMLKSLPGLGNKPEANATISQMMQAKAAINMARGDVVSAYQNGEISASDARKQLGVLNKKSIMSPELKAAIDGLGPFPSAPQAQGAPSSAIPPEAIADLKANPQSAAQFDEVFGPGAAMKVMGQ